MIRVRKISHATFETPDLERQIAYYTDVLGFTGHFVFGDPPVYARSDEMRRCFISRRTFGWQRPLKDSGLHPDVFLWVQEVDKVFAEHKRRGARMVEEIADQAWDARQYVIEDPNSYHIKVAEPIDRDEA